MASPVAFDKPAIIQSREGVSSGHTTFYRYGPAREIASRVDAAEWSTLIGNGTLEVQYLNGVELEIRKSTPTSANVRVQRHVAGMAIETLSRTATQVNGEWVQTADPQQPPVLDLVFGDNLGSTHLLLRVNASGAEVERHYQAFDVSLMGARCHARPWHFVIRTQPDSRASGVTWSTTRATRWA